MQKIKKLFPYLVAVAVAFAPSMAHAEWGMIDSLNLAPFVPLVLDAMMMVATGMYEFFVGHGDGVIYLLVWGFLLVTLALNAVKPFIPKSMARFFGFSGGGEMAGGITGEQLIQDSVMKPALRAIIAAVVLLQLRPVYITEWLINPFLQLGSLYTSAITDTVNQVGVATANVECPPDIVAKGWISESSCRFLVQPVSDLAYANNIAIKRGVEFIDSGLRGLITLVPHGGADFLSLVTGTILTATFFSSNLFMALLIIQAIFHFGMSLALYPFQVLTYVATPSSKWMDIWPAFSGITKALQKLIITMIACAFILVINLAVIRALFNWNAAVFVVSAGGAASSNVPSLSMSAMGFGSHSMLWMSSILTFYLMYKIFELTRQQLDAYVGGGADNLYKQVKSDTNTLWRITKKYGTSIAKWVKKK